MQDPNYDFIGTGWGFPPAFDNTTGEVKMSSSIIDIRESLAILLATSIGERLMQPTYGCNLSHLQFEPISANLVTHLRNVIRYAIIEHEPRIIVNGVSISTDQYFEGKLGIEIDFTIPSTNTRYNFVYPYYLNEGSDIRR